LIKALQALDLLLVEGSNNQTGMKSTAKALQKAQLDYLDELKRLLALTKTLMACTQVPLRIARI
jgi:hypothetical protein